MLWWLKAVPHLVSVICLYNVSGDFKTNVSGKINTLSIYKDISSGFKLLRSEKLLMNLLIMISILNLVLVSYYNNILIFLNKVMHQTPEQIGMILDVASLGSLAGAFSIK